METLLIQVQDSFRQKVAEAIVEMADRSVWGVQYFLTPQIGEGLVKYQPFRWRGVPWKTRTPFLRLDEIIFIDDLYDLSPAVPDVYLLPATREEQNRVFKEYYDKALLRALNAIPDTIVFLDNDPFAVERQRITMEIVKRRAEVPETDVLSRHFRSGLRACAEFVAIQPAQFFHEFASTLQHWCRLHQERAKTLLDRKDSAMVSLAIAEAYTFVTDVFLSLFSL